MYYKEEIKEEKVMEEFDCEHPSYVKKCPICMQQLKKWWESNL